VTDTSKNETEQLDRKKVRQFFSLRIKDSPTQRETNWTSVWWAMGIGLVVGAMLAGVAGAVVLPVLSGIGVLVWDNARAATELEAAQGEIESSREKLANLAHETRKVQSADLTKAILRVFERTQIDRSKLRVLDQLYIFEDEQNLLEDESRERKLGDLVNKSIRMISQGGYNNKAYRKIYWTDTGRTEQFLNPMRLVLLFLTETQLVICDVEIDSMDGDLREEIQRVALSKIVNVRFVAERTRFTMSHDQIIRMAEDLNFEPEKIEEIRRSFNGSSSSKEWIQEEVTSVLNVSRTDAGSITVPIRSEIYFGGHRSALDDEGGLTEDEIKVDRMINELNRLVESG
jgi:hypothetical protein